MLKKMSKKLIIIGLSNNAKLAAHYFGLDTAYSVEGFAIHRKFISENKFCNKPVFPLEDLHNNFPPKKYDVFVAVGYSEMNDIREKLYNEVKSMGYELPNYISPRCTFLTDLEMGDNNFILEDNTIQPFVKIGSNNVLWAGNHIGHDVEIGNHNFITSHVVISGFTRICNSVFLGVNCTLRDDITISSKTLVAAGSVIMKSTKEKEVYLPTKAVLHEKTSDQIKI